MVRDGSTEPPIIQINLTHDELRTLAYAMHAFAELAASAPIIEQMASRSDAMRARRAATRLTERFQALAQAYGIEI